MGKFTKKLKKFAKKVAPIAALGLGAAALGRKKYNTSPVSVDSGRGSNLRNILKSAMPGNLSRSMGPYRDNTGEGAKTLASPKWNQWHTNLWSGAKKGGRAGKDFGSRGVGKAKRGFGRALKKGRK